MTDESNSDPDSLAALRQRLQDVEEIPLDQRPALFEQLNRALAEELSRLEEV